MTALTTAMAAQTATGVRPADTFPVRLAIVRAVYGWNYDQAAKATGIGSETWRTWEKGKRHCTDVAGVAKKISDATGLDPVWIVFGGPLASVAQSASGNADSLHNTCCPTGAPTALRSVIGTESRPSSITLVHAA